MKILFISRAYPPVVGGIENQNYELARHLARIADVRLIANKKGKMLLPFFLPWLLLSVPMRVRHYDAILLGDGVLALCAWWIKLFFSKKPCVCIVHGLDLTYQSTLYQKLWGRTFIPACDRLIAVGNQTILEGMQRGITKEKFVFVPNGIDVEKFTEQSNTHADLLKIIGVEHADKKIILTSGRLARRKGVAWFVRSVMPLLDQNVLYVVAGQGPDRGTIEAAVKETGATKRVLLLGPVSDATRNTLFHTSDVFVQPNIHVDGDIEGFGISVVEAAASGAIVIASDLEGLKDAIKNEENGFLVPSGDTHAWKEKITTVLSDDFDRDAFGKKAQLYVAEHYNWKKIAQQYLEEIKKIAEKR